MSDLWPRLGSLLLTWTIATMAAGAAGYAVLVAGLDLALDFPDTGELLALPVAGLAAGALAGLLQKRLLQPYWPAFSGWIWRTALGWAVGLPLAVGLSLGFRELVSGWPDSYRLTVFLVSSGFAGLAASLGQWLLFRGLTERHPWWLLANAVGWFSAWIVVLAVGLFLGQGEPLPVSLDRIWHALVLGGLAGFIIGFEQGVALVGLLAQEAWEKSRSSRELERY